MTHISIKETIATLNNDPFYSNNEKIAGVLGILIPEHERPPFVAKTRAGTPCKQRATTV